MARAQHSVFRVGHIAYRKVPIDWWARFASCILSCRRDSKTFHGI